MDFKLFERMETPPAQNGDIYVTLNLYQFSFSCEAMVWFEENFKGGRVFDIHPFTCESPRAIGFKAVPPARQKVNPQKQVSSKELRDYIDNYLITRGYERRHGTHRIILKEHEDFLYFDLDEYGGKKKHGSKNRY